MRKQKASRPSRPTVADASPPASPSEQQAFSRWLLKPSPHVVLILLLGMVAYANSFSVPFTFDDNASIVDNPVIKDLSTFLSGAGYAYNPRRFVGYLTIALNYHFGGLDVTGYHAVNLAIHLASALLVYAFARITFRTPFFTQETPIPDPRSLVPVYVPLLAALLFVAHPIQTQAVTYIIQRLASLVTFFYLGAVVCYLSARLAMVEKQASGPPEPATGKRGFSWRVPGWFALSLVCTVLAMRTKEIAATLPIVIVLCEFSFFGARARTRLLLLAPVLLTLLIIPIGLLVSGKPAGELLSDVSAMTRETSAISRGDYLLTQFSVIATYLRLLILPINQNLDYDYPVFHALFTPRVMLSLLLICGLLALAFRLYRRSAKGEREAVPAKAPAPLTVNQAPWTSCLYRLCAFGIAWFFITLSVESSLIPISDVIFEHRLYLPAAGAFLALAAGAALLAGRVPRRALTAIATIILLALTAATIARNTVWGNELLLWHDVLAKSPGKSRPYKNVGLLHKKEGELDEAIRYFEQAMAIGPDAEAYDNLGVAYYQKGRKADALKLLGHAKELYPEYAQIYTNIGKILLDADDIPNALLHLEKACRLAPAALISNNNLGAAYLRAGDHAKAILHLKKAQQGDPDAQDVNYNLSAAYYMAGSTSAAVQELEQILRVNPDHREAKELLRSIKKAP